MMQKIIFPAGQHHDCQFGDLLIHDVFVFLNGVAVVSGELRVCRNRVAERIDDEPCQGSFDLFRIPREASVRKVGCYGTSPAAEPRTPNACVTSTYVGTATIAAGGGEELVEIRRLAGGPLVGFDTAYLETLSNDPAIDGPVSPYDGVPIWISASEPAGENKLPVKQLVTTPLTDGVMGEDASTITNVRERTRILFAQFLRDEVTQDEAALAYAELLMETLKSYGLKVVAIEKGEIPDGH